MLGEHAQLFLGTERFSILRRIGAGGMGVVYEAFDRERDERVALKTLPYVEAGAVYQLKQEFRSLTDVMHPNLVSLHELFATPTGCFFTMELVEGVNFLEHVRAGAQSPEPEPPLLETLDVKARLPDRPTALGGSEPAAGERCDTPAPEGTADSLPSTRLLPLESQARVWEPRPSPPADFGRVRAALRQLAEGVGALHHAGKLHRDLKPSNVRVTPQGRVVVLDFGLVTELEGRTLEGQTEHAFAGTTAYMAPEQAAGQPLSEASDWYCVGVMLYEALTGRRPFLGDRDQILEQKLQREPPPPGELVPGLPEDLNDLCRRLVCRRPADRPSATEILQRLEPRPSEPRAASIPRATPRGKTPFVGRERHLQALMDAYEATRQGRAVAVYVHGRSGVGKTLLMQRFLEGLVQREEVVVLAGRCYERESVPYKALDSLVDALSRYLGHLSAAEGAELMPRDVQALARLFPVLLRVEAVADAPQHAADIPDKQELRRRAFAALRELLARLGDRKRLVLYIDDLQWGDTDSAALLTDLLRPPDPPILLLLSCYRSEYSSTSPCLCALLEARRTALGALESRELAVEPLSGPDASALALELLGKQELDAGPLADTIARESGGNPYFVHELVQYVQGGERVAPHVAQQVAPHVAQQVAQLAQLRDRRSSGERITLDEVLRARVARLPEGSRRLLEIVAVSGGPLTQADAFRAAALGDVLGDALGDARGDVRGDAPGGEAHKALALLRADHLLRSTGPRERDEIDTYHDRIRETVAASLSAQALAERHRRLATTLEAGSRFDPETVAVHFVGADDPVKAGHYYAVAADQAAEALAFDRAAKLYRLSLELCHGGEAEHRLLRSKLADALANAGRGGDAAREYLAATAGASAAEALELQRKAAMQSLISGHIDDGLRALATVLSAAGMKLAATPRRALFSLLFRRAQLRLRGLKFRERDTSQVSAEELSRVDICWSVAVGLSIVDTIRAADFQTRNLLLALRAGEPYRIARALAWEAAHVANYGGKASRRTAQLLHAAETLAQRIQHPHALGLTTLSGGIAAYMEGRWRKARELSERAETVFRERCTGVAWELDTAQSFALWSLFFLGEVGELRARLPVLLKEARERGDLYAATNLGTFVGYLTWLAADDPEGARRDLGEVMGQWSQQGFHVQHLTGLMAQVQIDLYRGDGPAAWKRITGQWPALAGSLFLRVQVVRIFMLHLRARAALAAATSPPSGAARPESSKGVEALLRAAEKDARRIERERMAWAEPLARLVRAGVAAARRDRQAAIGLLAAAVTGLEAADMGLFASAARRRHGQLLAQLLAGEEGPILIGQADAWMTAQKIAHPARMAAMHAPGFEAP